MTATGILMGTFFVMCGFGLVLAAVVRDRSNPQVLAWASTLASLLVLGAGGKVLLYGSSWHVELWQLPYLGHLTLQMDRLSALFVFVAGLVYLPVSVFSSGYMEKYRGHYSLRSFGAFYHLLFAAIVLTFIAGDVVLFLIGWEAMAIASYLLVNYEHERAENVQAGFLMFAMSEAGTLAVIVALLLLGASAGNLGFAQLRAVAGGLNEPTRWAVFLLSFFGFGVKAGLVPVNSWLPRAHPVAPANISAILSGVILNLGIYGIVRVNGDLLPVSSTAAGLVVLLIGAISTLVGILYATTNNDMKQMLAHSSIENIGIIMVGFGSALLFRIYQQSALAGMALIVALYHMTNHSVYKALLFLGAGAVDSQVGSRDMNRLGGLIKRMPWTSFCFLIGALSIAALPPFNGFVSEWFTLQTLLQSPVLPATGVKIAFAVCGAGLALTAGLAVTCFVKAFGMSFLGLPRSAEAQKAVEIRSSMKVPMGLLAAMCLLLGILPSYVIPVLNHTVSPLVGTSSAVDALVPPFFTIQQGNATYGKAFLSDFHNLGAQVGRGVLPGRGLVILHQGAARNPVVFAMSTAYGLMVLILLIGGGYLATRWLSRSRSTLTRPAWDGGVRRLTADMTYTATGFSNPVRVVFDAVFRPTTVKDISREAVAQHFRNAISSDRYEVHVVDAFIYQPTSRFFQWSAWRVSRMHVGKINAYAAYVLITLLLVLLISRL